MSEDLRTEVRLLQGEVRALRNQISEWTAEERRERSADVRADNKRWSALGFAVVILLILSIGLGLR